MSMNFDSFGHLLSRSHVVLEYDWESSIGHWICATSHAMRRALSTRLAEEGMTFRQWEVLAWLSVNGDLSQAELAECMGIEPHTLAGVLRRMERDGWLERRCCEHDRRKNSIFPTAKAEQVWLRAITCCHEVRARAVEGLSEEELAHFKRTCERIRANLALEGERVEESSAEPAAADPALPETVNSPSAGRRSVLPALSR